MARFETIRTAINAHIRANGNQEITGSILNSILTGILDAVDEVMTEEFEEQDQFIEDLQNMKIDKENDDYYPQMAVGVADNLAGVDVVDSEISFRRSGGGAISDGVARIESIRGNSMVWNQHIDNALALNGKFKSGDDSKATLSVDGDAFKLTSLISGSGKYVYYRTAEFIKSLMPKHTYLLSFCVCANQELEGFFKLQGSDFPSKELSIDTTWSFAYAIGSINSITSSSPYFSINSDNMPEGSYFKVKNVNLIDLTKMFGEGKEPATIEEYNQRAPMGVDKDAYNEGEVIHMDVQSLESQGVNAWDEKWELGGVSESGVMYDSSVRIRTKNYIPVVGGAAYHINIGSLADNATAGSLCWYDVDHNFIGYAPIYAHKDYTAPASARYCLIGFYSSYGTTYKNDICINISDISINGKYFPFVKRMEDLGIISKYFPNGMKSAGAAQDEIRYNKVSQKWEKVQRIGNVDMGSLSWNVEATAQEGKIRFYGIGVNDIVKGLESGRVGNILCVKYYSISAEKTYYCNKGVAIKFGGEISVYDEDYTDASAFKSAMQGVMLYYELAYPVVTELEEADQFKDMDYQVWNAGTEKAIARGKSAPLAAGITYGFNAIGKIKELEGKLTILAAKVAAL